MAVASWSLLAENDGPSARAGHAAAFAKNQVLWIFGGKDEAVLSDIWLFHEAAKAWTSSGIAEVFSAAPSARKEHVAVTDGNGDLWIHGGQDDTVFSTICGNCPRTDGPWYQMDPCLVAVAMLGYGIPSMEPFGFMADSMVSSDKTFGSSKLKEAAGSASQTITIGPLHVLIMLLHSMP